MVKIHGNLFGMVKLSEMLSQHRSNVLTVLTL
jgi:hypothetical protein